MATRAAQLGLRAWQLVFSILIMALIGNMLDNAFSGNPGTVNYAMYTAAFSLFTLFYLVPASINIDWSGHPIIMIVVDTLNAIFFLASGIALAAKLQCRDCSNSEYTLNNEITNGAVDRERRCREAQASVAFLFFTWAGYTASMVVSIVMFSQSGGARLRPRTGAAPSRPNRPSMGQV